MTFSTEMVHFIDSTKNQEGSSWTEILLKLLILGEIVPWLRITRNPSKRKRNFTVSWWDLLLFEVLSNYFEGVNPYDIVSLHLTTI